MKKQMLVNDFDIRDTLLEFAKYLRHPYAAPGNKIAIMFDKQHFKNKNEAIKKFKTWFKKRQVSKLNKNLKLKHKSIRSVWDKINVEKSFVFSMPDYSMESIES